MSGADGIRAALDSAIVDGTTPGACALILAPDRRFVHASGTLHRMDGAAPVTAQTVFDLASLTKLLSTTLLTAAAVDDARLRLDETPWPAWPGVTIEHVLRHESGLPAWRPLFEGAKAAGAVGLPAGRQIVVDAARAVALEVPPGSRTLYSDIGMIALGALLEERFGAPLDVLFAQHGARAYGPRGLRFVRLDVDGFHPAVPDVAPTERCQWRRRAMHGQVHDENCFAMGGVSGHAGLFGSIEDVEAAARFFLEMPPTLQRFAVVPPAPRRPIGFDRTTGGGSTSDALSESTVGHLAFTGCSLWIDPVGAAAYVLLTNRIHETREGPEKILALRRSFHRAAAAWVRAAG